MKTLVGSSAKWMVCVCNYRRRHAWFDVVSATNLTAREVQDAISNSVDFVEEKEKGRHSDVNIVNITVTGKC